MPNRRLDENYRPDYRLPAYNNDERARALAAYPETAAQLRAGGWGERKVAAALLRKLRRDKRKDQ